MLAATILALAGAQAFSLPLMTQLSARTVTRQPKASPLLRAGGGVPDVPFASAYAPSEISALWVSLKKIYGSDAAARAAVEQNNQVLCPVYASPELLAQTHGALVKLVGKEDAQEIIAKNPAVLTCGAREIASADPAEIKSTASTRQILDKYVNKPEFLGVALLVVGLLRVIFLKAIEHP
jgi:hypothetical protein